MARWSDNFGNNFSWVGLMVLSQGPDFILFIR